MKTLHTIEWLIHPDNNEVVDVGVKSTKMAFPYPSEIGTGYTEHIELLDEIKVIQNVHQFTGEDRPDKIPLGIFEAQFPSTMFGVNTTHSGELDCYSYHSKLHFKTVPGIDLFGMADGYRIEQWVYTEEDIFSSVLLIPEATLIKLLGVDVVQVLCTYLGIHSTKKFNFVELPQSISKLLMSCSPDHLEGALRALYGQSVILQYLLKLHLHASGSGMFYNDLKTSHHFNVKDVYQELVEIQGKIPDLSSLAKKYNVTSEKLNYAFSSTYGQSIFSFLSAQRLQQARLALEKTDIPMKVLAHKIGYSHVNHFISAFKKKYGITPGSLRKQPI